MRKQSAAPVHGKSEYEWPVDLSTYDRSPTLTKDEAKAIAAVLRMREARDPRWLPPHKKALSRLLRPIDEICKYLGAQKVGYRNSIRKYLMLKMHKLGTSYWAWGHSDWIEVLGRKHADFEGQWIIKHCRNYLIAFSYLIGFTDIHLCGEVWVRTLAERVFGKEAIRQAVETIQTRLDQFGYSDSLQRLQVPFTLYRIFLIIRSPRIEDITLEALIRERDDYQYKRTRGNCVALSRVLTSLGILSEPLEPRVNSGVRQVSSIDGVAAEWHNWAVRWRSTSTLEPPTRKTMFFGILKAGRWLTEHHPEITSPTDWTYEIAIEYVAALNNSKIGDWVIGTTGIADKIGKPLSPRGFCSNIASLRTFFRDCQEWGWIPRVFSPTRALRLPSSVRAKIEPNPKVISYDIWAKLLGVGLSLTEDDLPTSRRGNGKTTPGSPFYPLEMVRAVAIVWLFAGLRVNEIVRLRVGCIRWGHEEKETATEVGGTDVNNKICFLDVPVSKGSRAYAKPVDRPVGDAINSWERVLPLQNVVIDHKTNEAVQYLFSYRGQRLSKSYINKHLIPLLCKKAGVPEMDAAGDITSHRARSTIASQLFNSPNDSMSLFEIQEWLGHRNVSTTQSYVRITPTTLARKYAQAKYFERNLRMIRVLIDKDTIMSGAAAQGEPWQYYDLGHGWCSNPFFVTCPHRMACARCTFYAPKESSRAQLLEQKGNLLNFTQEMPLTEEEAAAVDGDVKAVETLVERLADVPTPEGPTPRQLIQIRGLKKDAS